MHKIKTLFTFDGSFADFLLALGAVRNYSMDTVSEITLKLKDETLISYARPATFINHIVTEADAADYDYVVALDVVREECEIVELDEKRALKAEIDAKIKDIAQQFGVEEDSVQRPPEYQLLELENPTWHKLEGYEYVIKKITGVDMLPREWSPYLPLFHKVREKANRFIHENRAELKAGNPFIIVQGIDYFSDMGLEFVYPDNWGCVFFEDLSPEVLMGLLTHKYCFLAAGPVTGGLTYMAAAAGIPAVIETLTRDTIPYWELTRSERAVQFDISDANTVKYFKNNLLFIYKSRFGIELE